MKKIVLSVSVCMLALMAGCTKENVNEQQPEGKGLTVVGTISDPASRVEVGAYDPAAEKVALYWMQYDEIALAVYDKEGNIVQYTPYPNLPSYKMKCISNYSATTTTPSTTTGFEASLSKLTIPETVTEADIYSVYSPTSIYAGQSLDMTKMDNPIVREQRYNVMDNKAENSMFLVSKASYTGQATVELQFTNAFATMMVGVKGDAKIDSIKVANPAYFMTYGDKVTVNATKAPKAGTRDTKMLASYVGEENAFINDMDGEMPIDGYMDAVLQMDRQLQLKSEVKWLPIMIMPLTGVNEMPFDFTIYATDKEGTRVSVTRTVTVPANVDDITSNSIVYVSLKDINATDLNQNPPKTDWQAGDVILEDNFSWVQTNWDNTRYDIYGWTDPYNNAFFPKNNAADAATALSDRGYILTPYSPIKMLYSYDGMLQLGEENSGPAPLTLSLSELFSYTGDVAVTFKAAPYYDKYGQGDGGWETGIPVTATDNSNELRNVIIDTDSNEPFTWYEYTLLIENVSSNTQITFGASDLFYMFFLDDIKVSIANGETENTAGTKIDRPAPTMMFAEPELIDDAATINLSPVADVVNGDAEIAKLPNIRFAINGPWQLVVPEGNDWLKVHKVDWSIYDDPERATPRYNDAYGNEMTSIFYLQVMEDNDSGDARNVDLELRSGNTVLATYNVTQPAAGEKIQLYAADFGDHTEAVTVSNTLTSEDWGIGAYELSWLGIAYNAENTNPGLQLGNTAKSTYEGASGLGNLYFLGSVAQSNNGGGGDDSGFDPSPMTSAEGDTAAEFVINIPQASIENASYLYLNFGLWSRAAFDVGEFEIQVTFNDTPTTINPQTIQGWKFFENRIEVPQGTTSCTIKMYPVNKYGQNAASAYRIDDVYVAVR